MDCMDSHGFRGLENEILLFTVRISLFPPILFRHSLHMYLHMFFILINRLDVMLKKYCLFIKEKEWKRRKEKRKAKKKERKKSIVLLFFFQSKVYFEIILRWILRCYRINLFYYLSSFYRENRILNLH